MTRRIAGPRAWEALTAAVALAWTAGCRPPLEEAPEDIDDPIRYLFQHFDDGDDEGLQRAVATYVAFLEECEATATDDGGNDRPECDLEQGLSTEMLVDADLDALIADGKLAGHPDEQAWEEAVALVVARRMPTTVAVIEDVLMLPEQDAVFPQFEEYERTLLTSQDDYLAGDAAFLRTANDVVTNYLLNVTATYLLYLDFRQIDWDDDGTTRRVVVIRSWFADEGELSLDGARLAFTFSLELLIPYTGGLGGGADQVWRTQALWSHADIPGPGDDQAFWENQLRDGTIDGFDQLQAWIDEHR